MKTKRISQQPDKKQIDNKKDEISPLVKSLSGVLQFPDNFDLKKDRIKRLNRKHK